VPLPPYSTTGESPVVPAPRAKPSQSPVQVTHIPQTEPQPPIADPAKPTKMKVGIYDLEYNSFTQVSARRQVPEGTRGSISFADPADPTKTIAYENMGTYLKRSLDNRFALVYRAMVAAFAKHPPTEFDVSFFTAPEFFWNVPWSDFLNEVELQVSTDIYLDTVTANSRTLISKFPASQYGNIVLLPGTVAALKPNPGTLTLDGDFAATTKMIYDAHNKLVCTHNLPLDDKAHPRPAYMIWPKRVVSWIDFIDEANGENCDTGVTNLMPNPANLNLDNSTLECSLRQGLSVTIAYVTSSVGQSFDSKGKLLSKSFQNDIVDGLPFGIDICLDYAAASVQKDQSRMAQLDERKFKLDFLLSAGMSLDPTNYANTPYIQYAVHNDGIISSNETSSNYDTIDWDTIDWDTVDWDTLMLSYNLYSNVVKINYDRQQNNISLDKLPALDADSPYDDKKGLIAVDESSDYAAPKDADATGIPKILDPMNPANVRIWSLDVDISDTSSSSDTIIASNSASAKSTSDNIIQVVD
jgi:hypothetical protein